MTTNADRFNGAADDAPVTGGTWQVVTKDSRIGFRVRKMGLYFVKGRFAGFSGRVELDAEGVPRRGEVEIEAASVSTRMPPRDWHLRTSDFLATSRHPRIRVSAEDIEPVGDGALKIPAVLEIRGVQRPVPLVGHVHAAGEALVLHVQGLLDRRDVGVRPRRPFEWIVGRDVHLDVELILDRIR